MGGLGQPVTIDRRGVATDAWAAAAWRSLSSAKAYASCAGSCGRHIRRASMNRGGCEVASKPKGPAQTVEFDHWHRIIDSPTGCPHSSFTNSSIAPCNGWVDPVEEGGLGLDHKTAAAMAGHDDGGWLISNYTKLAERRARERAKRATQAYRQRNSGNAPDLRAANG